MAASRSTWSKELQTLGGRVEFARKRVDMTQVALAKRVNVGGPTITRLESGERLAELDTLIAIARVLHVPVGWLIAGEGTLPEAVPVDAGDTDRRRRKRDAPAV